LEDAMQVKNSLCGPSLAINPIPGVTARMRIDLRWAPGESTVLLLWENGAPRMFGVLIPDVRQNRGREAVSWFARQYQVAVAPDCEAFSAVQCADPPLPLLLIVFDGERIAEPTRLMTQCELMETVAVHVLRDPEALPAAWPAWVPRGPFAPSGQTTAKGLAVPRRCQFVLPVQSFSPRPDYDDA
jgi:hypothetical protein